MKLGDPLTVFDISFSAWYIFDMPSIRKRYSKPHELHYIVNWLPKNSRRLHSNGRLFHRNWLGISQKVGENIKIVMVVNRAGWHRGDYLKIPHNIILYYLPLYSPELNPIERYGVI